MQITQDERHLEAQQKRTGGHQEAHRSREDAIHIIKIRCALAAGDGSAGETLVDQTEKIFSKNRKKVLT